MNIVYLIGNGFDVNLGMATKYRDFYDYYINLPDSEYGEVGAQFKKDLKENLENWSDLEFALGEYLEKLNAEQAIELHGHLVHHLSTYIKLEESRYPFDKNQTSVFASYLIDPQIKLLQKERNEVGTHKQRWSGYTWDVKIITFNYSKSVERLISDPQKIIGHHGSNREINYTGLEHIHGFTDDRMILGVNDPSQIKNEELQSNPRVVSRYVKPNCNATTRLDHDTKCTAWIENAHLICTFGLSFGDTDKKWWEVVGNRLMDDCKMILFEFNPKKRFNGNQHVEQFEEEEIIKNRFLDKANVQEELRGNTKKKMYVAYNTDMFKMDIGKKQIQSE